MMVDADGWIQGMNINFKAVLARLGLGPTVIQLPIELPSDADD
jgi:hypothetical protein